MAALQYLGSKLSLIPWLREQFLERWGAEQLAQLTLVDAFAGTGAVTAKTLDLFRNAVANDLERYSELVCKARFCPPAVRPDMSNVPAVDVGEGDVAHHFSDEEGGERLYFSAANARLIDGVREAARAALDLPERDYVVGCLIMAADRVGNGTAKFNSFLKELKPQARRTLELSHPPDESGGGRVTVTRLDAAEAAAAAPVDSLLYLDPPYTKYCYSTLYHVLNHIAQDPSFPLNVPNTKTGTPGSLRVPSAWCATAKGVAEDALRSVLRRTPALHVAMSYSDEGIMSAKRIEAVFAECGFTCKRAKRTHRAYADGAVKRARKEETDAAPTEYLFMGTRAGAPDSA